MRVLVAQAATAQGDAATAEMELDAARAAFVALGAAPELEQLERLAPGQQRRAAHGLTSREVEVVRLLATGATNRAMADELFISEKTVARHLSNIYLKLDLSTRAAAFAFQHGIA